MALGTAAILGLGSLAGTAMQVGAANKAANVQKRAADDAIGLQTRIYEEGKETIAPWVEGGKNALEAYMYNLGIGEKPEGYEGYSMSPAAKYAMETGVGDVNAAFSARGGYNSGAALEALEGKRSRIVSADMADYFNRLAGISGAGQAAAAAQTSAGTQYAGTASNTMMAGAGATAQGYLNAANAIGSGINDAAGIYGYFNRANPTSAYAAPTLTRGIPGTGMGYNGADMMNYWLNR